MAFALISFSFLPAFGTGNMINKRKKGIDQQMIEKCVKKNSAKALIHQHFCRAPSNLKKKCPHMNEDIFYSINS